MSNKKRLGAICAVVGLPVLLIALLLIFGIGSVPDAHVSPIGYESRIFNTERIHSIEIFMDDWEGFLETCEEEKYARCTVVINGEQFDNVGIRATDSASATAVAEMGSKRHCLDLEFDHYNSEQTYYGLDKLNLNNLMYDNTMMKDYLTYRLMAEIGTAAPLCSYAKVHVNSKALGLYLAVEAIEESFLKRNYGNDYGELYQPNAPSEDLTGSSLQDVKLQYINNDPGSYPNLFSNAKTPITEEDQARLIQSLKQLSTGKKLKHTVDIEAVIRYFAVHTFVCNENSYTGSAIYNYSLYEKDGQLTMLPGDYNLAFGGSSAQDASAVINASIYSPVTGGNYDDRPMLSWIQNSNRYTWLYRRYYMEILNVDTVAMVEQTEKMLAPYVYRDPSKFCTFEEFEAGVSTLKQFLELRAESIQQQLSGKEANVDVADLNLTKMGGLSLNSLHTDSN